MAEITQMEAKRFLEREFEELNAFTGRPGMKKYAYGYAKRKGYNKLVMDTLRASFREKGLYSLKRDFRDYYNHFYEHGYNDGLIEVLDDAVKHYTFNNRVWGRKQHKWMGRWKGPESMSLENIRIERYWGHKRRSYMAYPVYNYYSDYFFLCTHRSLIFYDIKTSKMVRGDLTKLQHPVFASIKSSKDSLKRILEIQNVDIRKNILKQLSWKYIEYAEVTDKTGDYRLLVIDFDERDDSGNQRTSRALRRVYLEMKNPSTGEIHMEAVHPDCDTVADAINYRRYGAVNPQVLNNSFISIPNWTPVQLS